MEERRTGLIDSCALTTNPASRQLAVASGTTSNKEAFHEARSADSSIWRAWVCTAQRAGEHAKRLHVERRSHWYRCRYIWEWRWVSVEFGSRGPYHCDWLGVLKASELQFLPEVAQAAWRHPKIRSATTPLSRYHPTRRWADHAEEI